MKTLTFAVAVVTALAVLPATTEAQAAAAEDSGVSIEYIAHASFVIESPGGTRILVDPYADRVWLGYDFPRDLDYDAVVITHPHYDHDGGEYREMAVPWSDDTPVYRDPGSFQVGDVELHGVAGKHADPYGTEFGQKNVVWIVEIAGLRIAHLGDNGPLTDGVVRGMGGVDIVLIPVDGEEHILSYEAIDDIVAAVAPRVVIPMHYRIPELEPADGPSDLGPIDPWLTGWSDVRRLASNVWRVDSGVRRGSADSGSATEVVVLRPSPLVPRPPPTAPDPGRGQAKHQERLPAPPPSTMRPVTLSWSETPLRDVLQAFALFSGRSIVAGSGVEGVFVTADIKNEPWDLALQVILESRGLTATENERGIIRVSSYAELQDRDRVQPIVTRSYRISYARAEELQATLAPLLSDRGRVSVLASSNTLVVSDVERVHRVVKGLLGG